MNKLVEVKGLKKYFPIKGGILNRTVCHLKAVDGISFYINEKETFGVVGESGCGKSTTGKTIMRFHEPTAGELLIDGEDIFQLSRNGLRQARKKMQFIFQDPYSSLNPRMTVGDIIGEPLLLHENMTTNQRFEKVKELLNNVGLSPYHTRRYPHEFSGGQRQRIGIARALALNPKFIIADEAVSALDVSIQAQTINLLNKLQDDFGLTYMFISHDLSVVKHISNRIAVMYLGKIVEMADAEELFHHPMHPYTKALLSAIPVADPDFINKRILLKGDVPSPINPPPGCVFHTRCKYCASDCKLYKPELLDIGNNHYVACHIL
jgi:oligopeptide transport system ATP-binding protein